MNHCTSISNFVEFINKKNKKRYENPLIELYLLLTVKDYQTNRLLKKSSSWNLLTNIIFNMFFMLFVKWLDDCRMFVVVHQSLLHCLWLFLFIQKELITIYIYKEIFPNTSHRTVFHHQGCNLFKFKKEKPYKLLPLFSSYYTLLVFEQNANKKKRFI